MGSTEKLIPEQETGGKSDNEYTIECSSDEEAKEHFGIAKQRLLDVNHWHEIAGSLTAGFRLTDQEGREVVRGAQTGDYFKISIPAPGPGAGEGFDWVRVELMDDQTGATEQREAFGIRVRPAESPVNADAAVAHFFKDDATSTFLVERRGNKLKAAVHGRNELPNTEADKPLDKARNAVVAIGAMLGLSNPQWKSLVKGILKFN